MELIAPVRVVVVDDNAEHLFAIANALSVAGIPCVWHLYDNESHNLLPKPPAQGYDGIRLIIVASRTIIWSLVKQVRVGLVPIFHGLHRRTALER